jgi:hypothetical protein
MKVKQITAQFAFTKNLGNYQSLRAEAGITVEVEDGENVLAVYEEAFQTVKDQVKQQCDTGGVAGR